MRAWVFSTGGDGLAAVFARATDALGAAVQAQLDLQSALWPAHVTVRARMAVHTGEAEERNGDYFGPALNRAARVMSTGHGGRILVTSTVRQVLSQLPPGLSLLDLGEFRLKDLETPEHLYQVQGNGLVAVFPPLRSLSARVHNLPAQMTSFVGRESELMELCESLMGTRLVTLVAAGGSGKTRLALQGAAELVEAFESVHFVELASLADPTMVCSRIIEAMGFVSTGETSKEVDAVLIERIAERHALLIIDNCEHLISARGARETLESAHGALVSNREWGIYWGMPYAVELSALALDRVGEHGGCAGIGIDRCRL